MVFHTCYIIGDKKNELIIVTLKMNILSDSENHYLNNNVEFIFNDMYAWMLVFSFYSAEIAYAVQEFVLDGAREAASCPRALVLPRRSVSFFFFFKYRNIQWNVINTCWSGHLYAGEDWKVKVVTDFEVMQASNAECRNSVYYRRFLVRHFYFVGGGLAWSAFVLHEDGLVTLPFTRRLPHRRSLK